MGFSPPGASCLKLREQQEIVYSLPYSRPKPRSCYSKPTTQIQWVEVAQHHSNGESLCQLAMCYGVSYEMVRRSRSRPRSMMVLPKYFPQDERVLYYFAHCIKFRYPLLSSLEYNTII